MDKVVLYNSAILILYNDRMCAMKKIGRRHESRFINLLT